MRRSFSLAPQCAMLMAGYLAAHAASAFAADIPAGLPPVRQDSAIQLLNERKDEQRQQQIEQAPAAVEAKVPTAAQGSLPLDTPVDQVPEQEPAFDIKQIELKGNTLLSDSVVGDLTQPFIGRRLGTQRINLLMRRITDQFVKRGYITTRVYLGEQNLASGKLVLNVVVGTIEAVTLNGQAFAPQPAPQATNGGLLTDAGTRWVFPDHPGQALNLTDLEQGVDQLNRLRRNQAEMQIQPGASAGGSVININNKPGDIFYYNVGLDNYGSDTTGIVRLKAGVEADNLIGLQESLSLSFIGTTESNALVASMAVPWGYNVFSYTLSRSEYQNLVGDTALVNGDSRGHTFGFNRILSRAQDGKTALDVTLSLWDSGRSINGLELTPQDLSVVRIALNRFEKFQWSGHSGYWSLEGGYSRGITTFGATRDADDLPTDYAHNQFNKFDANGSFSVALAQLGPAALAWRSSFSAQWAKVGLYSSQQIFAGGNDSVRGFSQDGISGDCGLWLRNEVSWANVPDQALGPVGMHLEPYVFLDGGHTRLLAGGLSQNIAGAGMGVRSQARWGSDVLTSELLVGRGLDQPASFGGKQTLVLASMSLNF